MKELSQQSTWISVESVQEIGKKQTNTSGPWVIGVGGDNEVREIGMTLIMGFATYFHCNGKLLWD